MTAARALGLTRSGAARFSFLLAIPGIAAAGAYEGLKVVTSGSAVDWPPMVIGVVFSALSSLACIHLMIRFIERIGLLPFTIYRLAIAALIVWHFS
jgi:undecaprenyl-diphosphatase